MGYQGNDSCFCLRHAANQMLQRTARLAAFTLILMVLAGLGVAHAAGQDTVKFTHSKLVYPTYTYKNAETVAPLFGAIENMGLYPYTRLDWETRLLGCPF